MDEAAFHELQTERDQLAARVRELEWIIKDDRWVPKAWGLKPSEVVTLNVLVLRGNASKPAILAALYGSDPKRQATDVMVRVVISGLRKKLGGLGIVIETIAGVGWQLDATSRSRLAELKAKAV